MGIVLRRHPIDNLETNCINNEKLHPKLLNHTNVDPIREKIVLMLYLCVRVRVCKNGEAFNQTI